MFKGILLESRARLETCPQSVEAVLKIPIVKVLMTLAEKEQADIKSEASWKASK